MGMASRGLVDVMLVQALLVVEDGIRFMWLALAKCDGPEPLSASCLRCTRPCTSSDPRKASC